MRFIRSNKSKHRGFIPIRSKQAYQDRDSVLFNLGFHSYNHYLKSDLWINLKTQKIQTTPNCEICSNTATCVHHLAYNKECLQGLQPHKLVSLCNSCHQKIELDENGRKRTFSSSLRIAKKLLRRTGKWEEHTKRGKHKS